VSYGGEVSELAADLVITGCTALVHKEQEDIRFEENATIVVRDGVSHGKRIQDNDS
jgi:5-methylthioadenosine/S-adenosylhomocysteine deaminase